MSKTVDERVVQMSLENRQFESNAKETMSTLDKLKQSLNFKGASKSFEEVNTAMKGINLSGLVSGIEEVSKRFSTLGIIGVTALQNITNQVLNTAKSLVNDLTLAPIFSGFQEYETQIGAIQTILANTSSQGTTLEQVNAALDELNTYADKTIYNFTEMTRNIGTFTAAGVDLKTSVEAIKGIANLAAMSGSTSQQASTAMYQLSQALAAGRVSLQDWNSVVNAGMGGKVFQEALMQTAETMGIVVDRSKSFRESISATGGQDSWLTSEVLLNTLRQFTGDMTDAELAAMGFNDAQIQAIQAQAKTANEAATQVKTLTQLLDTMKESVSSGWTETWEIIIGDFGEARTLFTQVSNVFGDFVSNMSEARNNLLRGGLMSGWKQFLNEGISNQEDFLLSVEQAMNSYGYYEGFLDDLIETHGSFEDSLKSGWMTTDILADSVQRYTDRLNTMSMEELEAAGYTSQHVEQLNELNAGIKDGSVNLDEFLMKMSRDSGRENIIEGLSQAFRVLLEVIKPIQTAYGNVFEAMKPEQLYEMTESFRNFFTNLSLGEENAKNLQDTFQGLFSVFDLVGKGISSVWKSISGYGSEIGGLASKFLSLTGSIGRWLTSLNEAVDSSGALSFISDTITYSLDIVFETINKVTDGIGGFVGVLTSVKDVVSSVFTSIFGVIKKVFDWIRENISAGDIFAGLAGGGIFVLAKKLSGLIDKIKGLFDKPNVGNIKNSLTEVLDSLHESLTSFQQGIKVASIIGIAVAITLLVSSLRKLSEINPASLLYSLGAMEIIFIELNSGFKSFQKTLNDFNSKGSIRSAITMVAMAEAINILAEAIGKIGSLNFDEIIKGLIGIGGLIGELVVAINFLGKSNGTTLRTSVAIIALSFACKNLADAMKSFGSMPWEEIKRGLVAMGGALLEFTLSLSVLGKFGGMGSLLGSVGMLISAQSLYAISENLEKLGSLDWETIKKGLVAMGIALLEFTASLSALSVIGGFGAILGGTAILISVQALDEISENLEKLGNMTWTEIGKGLTAMGVAFFELTAALSVLSAVGGFGALLGGGAILIASQSLYAISENLKTIGSMPWEEIQNGLAAMGAALIVFTSALSVLSSVGGFGSILGGVAILIASQSLSAITDGLQKLGSMSWDEIGRGLAAMGGALLEIAGISGALGYFTGIAGIIGAGSIYIAIQGLDDLANALQKFASMSWEEIGRSLTAMGGALGGIALGSLANTFSFLGSLSISKLVEPIGNLADSMKKWQDVSVPNGLGSQLEELATGVRMFTLSGWGADSIATLAEPIGVLADSIKKWSGVSVPEGISDQISSLADGIGAFTFSGLGAEAIATFAIPIGDLADSMKKWSGVVIPEDLGDRIGSLAGGIDAFTLSGWGADSLTKVAPGLGSLAEAIKQWQDVTIPATLGGSLIDLANGVKSFSFAFVAGWSIDTIKQPLIDLADAVSKWNNVTIPSTLKDDLQGLADGVNAFSSSFLGGLSIGSITEPLSNLSDSVRKWIGIDISGIGPQLIELSEGLGAIRANGLSQEFVTQLDSFINVFSSDTFSEAMQNITLFASSIQQLSSLDFVSTDGMSSLFASLGTDFVGTLASNFSAGVSENIPVFQQKGIDICNAVLNSMKSQYANFTIAGNQSGMNYSNGLSTKSFDARNAGNSVGMAAVGALNTLLESFRTAGLNAGEGFVQGLNSYVEKAAEAARSMAQASVDAVNSALDAHSPSRKMEQSGEWGGEGLVKGFDSMLGAAKNSAYRLGEKSVSAMKEAISRARDVMTTTYDLEPTIRPVIDLSDVTSKAKTINSVFDANRRYSIGFTSEKVSRASSGMSVGQNGVKDSKLSEEPKEVIKSFSFTQNNYSPKSLSRVDIYRQTKNQFSAAKEAVNKKK